jgi:hypothetical protein
VRTKICLRTNPDLFLNSDKTAPAPVCFTCPQAPHKTTDTSGHCFFLLLIPFSLCLRTIPRLFLERAGTNLYLSGPPVTFPTIIGRLYVESVASLMETLNSEATDRQTGDPWDHPDIMATIDEMINNHYLKKQHTPVSRYPVSGSTLHSSDAETTPLKPLPEENPPKPYAYNRNRGHHKQTSTPSGHPPTNKHKPQRVWKPKRPTQN